MKTDNSVLMQRARQALEGRWGLAIGACLISILIGRFPALNIIIAGPLAVGMAEFSLKYSRRQKAELSDIFNGFNYFWNGLLAYLLILIFVVLWSLLLIIPGIIAAISYSQTFFLLSENPSMDPMAAIDKSKALMNGYKWKYFGLCLRFFGWALLCILTLGIGFLWLIPWMQVTFAGFYDDLKKVELEEVG
jgi:uncharacterized membrane protein